MHCAVVSLRTTRTDDVTYALCCGELAALRVPMMSSMMLRMHCAVVSLLHYTMYALCCGELAALRVMLPMMLRMHCAVVSLLHYG